MHMQALRVLLVLSSVALIAAIHGVSGEITRTSHNRRSHAATIHDAIPSSSEPPVIKPLEGTAWIVSSSSSEQSYPAVVPGDIYTDLERAGVIQDPYYRFNDIAYQWIGESDWTYTTSFLFTGSSSAKALLVFEGVDTIANVSLNGVVVGSTNNMFRRFMFEVTDVIVPGVNTLAVAFTSAVTWSNEQSNAYPYFVPFSTYPTGFGSRNFVRKEQCSFGWDWGPAFAPMGITRSVYLVSVNELSSGVVLLSMAARVFAQPFTTLPEEFLVEIDTEMYSFNNETSAEVKVTASLASMTNSTVALVSGGVSVTTLTLSVSKPELWWPHGYGAHPVYLATSVISDTNGVVQNTSTHVGFRSAELVIEPTTLDTVGTTMFFRVNGVPIFAKGANYIPVDAFRGQTSQATVESILADSIAANMNTIRVWGGGYYQEGYFYDKCDQLGLMVWQEFMFACSMYPRDTEFLENVEEEIKYQISRLSHHPSIVLWSGNNENEGALYWYPQSQNNLLLYAADYVVLNTDTVMETVTAADPSRPFWTSSPSNGLISEDPYIQRWGNVQNVSFGDVHYYNYNANCSDVTTYPRPRFASEYGFQSVDSLFTTATVLDPATDYVWDSPAMLHRQHHPDGQAELVAAIQTHFSFDPNAGGNTTAAFVAFLYMTQAMQSLCIRAETEYYRSLRSEVGTMGTLYWQLNSIWPAPTWSSIEYGGRWKMLHYQVKQSYADVIVTSYVYTPGVLSVYVVSDLQVGLSGTLVYEYYRYDNGAHNVFRTITNVAVPPLGSSLAVSYSLADAPAPLDEVIFVITFTYTNASQVQQAPTSESPSSTVISTVYYPAQPANVTTLQAPTFSVAGYYPSSTTSNGGLTFSIESSAVAPYTFWSTEYPGVFDVNNVVMLPGTPVVVTFFPAPSLGSLTLSELFSSFYVQSLGNPQLTQPSGSSSTFVKEAR